MAKNFRQLQGKVRSDPERAARVDANKRAMEAAMNLADLREQLEKTQQNLAKQLGMSQANISRIEREVDPQLSTLDRYVAALGGQLEVRAVFPDEVVALMVAKPKLKAVRGRDAKIGHGTITGKVTPKKTGYRRASKKRRPARS